MNFSTLADQKTAVLFVGMHRSGTSAAAGIFSRLGVNLGSNLIRPDKNNPKGYYEHLGIVRLHDEILAALDSSWDDPRPLPVGWERDPRLAGLRRELRSIVTNDFGQMSLWGIKDPRLCRLLPLWLMLLDEIGVAAKVVLVVRQPGETIQSLRHRDGFRAEQSAMLWLSHIVSAERSTRHLPRIPLLYEDLLQDWRAESGRVRQEFRLDLRALTESVVEDVEEFLSPDLRRQKGHPVPTVHAPQNLNLNRVYDALLAWRQGQALREDIFDEAAEALADAEANARPIADYLLTKAGSEIQRISGLLGCARKDIAQLEGVITQKTACIADLEEALAQKSSQLSTSTTALEDTRSQLAADAERARLEIQEARSEADRARLEADTARAEAAALRASEAAHAPGVEQLAAQIAQLALVSEAARAREAELGRQEIAQAEDADAAIRARDAKIHNLLLELGRVSQSEANAHTYAQEINEQCAAVQRTTAWQVTWALLRICRIVPPGLRRPARRSAKLVWWSATLRLPSKLHQAREARAAATAAAGDFTAAAPDITIPGQPDMFATRSRRPTANIAAVVHLHYPELWPELREALGSMPCRFDLFVSVTEGAAEEAVGQIRADFPAAQIVVFPNHGRDMLPFLTFADTGVLNQYRLVCKLHAKRTVHRPDGDLWRHALLHGVLRDKDQVQRIIAAFEADPDLGIVVGDGQVFGGRPEHWVDNEARVLELGARIGVEYLPDDASFPGGSIYWIRPFLLRTLVALRLTPADFELEPLTRDGSTAHAVERLVGLVCAEAGMRIEESGALPLAATSSVAEGVRVIAYYLPQYHPTPENDAWWGNGFTEWANVARARPMFQNHRQPKLPADLGFYDLRLPESREAQADLARRYGLGGFCYYYYWFNGRGMLRRPLEEMVASGQPDFPFMICWANEPWSRNWDGGNRELLLPQDYEPGWPRAFARDIAPLLADPRYIRLDGRPILLIYRVMHIPDAVAALAEIRDELRDLGIGEVHLGGGWVGFVGDEEPPEDPAQVGLDAWFEFPPHRLPAQQITDRISGLDTAFTGKVYSYRSAVDNALASANSEREARRHRAVMAGWDNTPRRMFGAHVFYGATPALLRRWLRTLVRAEAPRAEGGERIIFVNAWNEWAEGAYLEPDRDFGHGWLEAVASAIGISTTPLMPEVEASPEPVAAEGSIGALAARMDGEEWVEMMIRSADAQQVDGVTLPAFPAAAWQSMFVGSSNAHAIREAAAFQALVKGELASLGRPLSATDRVLDFGCGWGRYIRLFMKDVPQANLFGVDVDTDMIGFCRVSGLPAQFTDVPPLGPTGFGAGSFDLIYAYSVFSHLSEAAHIAWMEEFRRILTPGGVLIFTTQTRRFLTWTETLRDKPAETLSRWELSLRTAFPEVRSATTDYDEGRFVFAPTGGGEHRPSSFYGEAAIPEIWLRARWEDAGFALRTFIDDPTRCPQAVAVMQASG